VLWCLTILVRQGLIFTGVADVRRREYTILTVGVSILEAAAMVGIVVWLLPHWGLNIPIWGLILLILAFGAYQVVTYRLGRRALDRKPVLSPESIVGCYGEASTKLTPDGYVKVKGELWRAFSTGLNIDEGKEIVVMEVKRLTLLVAPAPRNNRIEDITSQ